MHIFKTTVALQEDSGNIYSMDTIEWEGNFWLVPEWLENTAEGWTTPARIVLLSQFQHQVTKGHPGHDFVINEPIPKWVTDGKAPAGQAHKVVLIERPPIRIQGGRA